ncbi:MAG: glycosyltransferase [Candidatus Latescibacterota bacterium]|nr:MAG: glycosyltransferase [Candidatus Latescibacterota bacterium]
MDVVHVINNLPFGGAERFLLQLAPAQARLGCSVHVVTLVDRNPLATSLADSVTYRCLGRERLNDPRLAVDLTSLLRQLGPDVVHTHLFYADFFGRTAARLASVPRIVSTEHSTERGPLSGRRRAAMRWSAKFAHRIVAVSEAARRGAVERLALPESRFVVIPNGIDLAPWGTVEPLARDALRLAPDAIVAGFVGRLVESKGIETLLRALAAVANPRLVLLLVGDGPERQRLQQVALQLQLGDRVRWLGYRHDVPSLLKSFDLFLLPSWWEGHAISLLEAMAAGCACVVSAIPELVDTLGDAGRHVRPGDADALAASLRELSASASLRQELGRRALQQVRRFSIESAASRYVSLYNELVVGAGS